MYITNLHMTSKSLPKVYIHTKLSVQTLSLCLCAGFNLILKSGYWFYGCRCCCYSDSVGVIKVSAARNHMKAVTNFDEVSAVSSSVSRTKWCAHLYAPKTPLYAYNILN